MTDSTRPSRVELASNSLSRKDGDPYVYPYGVDIDFREAPTPPVVRVWQGDTHDAVSTRLHAREALEPAWYELIVARPGPARAAARGGGAA